ncbi:MAG: AMP-binding protein, partial [Algicola sp.]|nr:AMP-binding protein [Algicola sp.]
KLDQLPLLSCLIIQQGDSDFLLRINQHHIISDGWSQQLFYQELTLIYHALNQQQKPQLAELPFSYTDYSRWQTSWLTSPEAQVQRVFWQDYLLDCSTQLTLPMQLTTTSSAEQNVQGIVSASIDLPMTKVLKTLAQQHRGSLFNVLHSAFALLLARLSGQNDLTIGLPVTGRHVYGTQSMLGMFLNNLPVRHQINLNDGYSEYLAQQVKNVEQVLSNQDMPLERILETVGSSRSADSTPLFQVLFNMMSLPENEPKTNDSAVTSSSVKTAEIGNKFDLTFYVGETSEGVGMSCSYAPNKFSHRSITLILAQYVSLLSQIGENAERRCGQYSLNVDTEFVDQSPQPVAFWPGSVVELFSKHARATPQSLAIKDEFGDWSYQDILRLSQATSAKLTASGVKQGDVVVIVATRQASLVVAIMASLQIGAVYCIVTPQQPLKRLGQQIDIVSPAVVLLTQSFDDYSADLILALKTTSTCIEVNMRVPSSDVVFVPVAIEPEQAACITFTSGSTGVPKAVVGKHNGLSGYLDWLPNQAGFGPADRFSMLSGLAHDPLQRDIFGALCLGATLVVPSAQAFASLKLANWFKTEKISVTHLTPAMSEVICLDAQHSLTDSLPDLRVAFLTGEKLRRDTAQALQALNQPLRIFNCFGATESQRALTYYELTANLDLPAVIPLARRAKDTRLRLLNPLGIDCGVGEVGEIMIESCHLAKGYLNDEALSAARFEDFQQGYSRYRTGDLAIYLDQHRIKPLGRNDAQVNMRGFRIELGDIEAQLLQLPQISSAVVLAPDQKRLVAFVVLDKTSAAENWLDAVKQGLQSRLPEYMLPSNFVAMKAFPLNSSGKIDGLVLAQNAQHLLTDDYDAPQNDSEAKQAQVWAQLLDIDVKQLSVTANFFELGGNSLLLLKLIAALSQQGINRTIKQFYEHPTIRSMSVAALQSTDDLEMDDLQTNCLVKLNKTTKGPTLFVVHPLNGRVACYDQLATSLEGICPVVGIQAPYNFGCDWSFDSIPELANFYNTAIKKHQREGPYHLAGWSAGGLVAQHVAHLLTEQGDAVDYLMIMDSILVREEQTLKREQCLVYAIEMVIEEKAYTPQVTAVIEQLSAGQRSGSQSDMTYPAQLAMVADLLEAQQKSVFTSRQELLMALNYFVNFAKADCPLTPTSIRGNTVLLQATDNTQLAEKLTGWQQTIVSSSQIIEVPGEHNKMLEGQCFDAVVGVLREGMTEIGCNR